MSEKRISDRESCQADRILAAMDMLCSGRFLARRTPLVLVPRCSRGSPDKSGSDKGKRSELLIAVTVKFFGGYRTSVW